MSAGSDHKVRAWQIVSFLSLPAREQQSHLGLSSNFRFPAPCSTESNFVFGVVLMALENRSGLEALDGGDEAVVSQLVDLLKGISLTESPKKFEEMARDQDEDWVKVRHLSEGILERNRLGRVHPNKAWRIDDLIETWGYLLKKVKK